MSSQSQPATGKQLAYLRALANETGTTFVSPRDRRQASREIDTINRLKRQNGRHVEPAHRPIREMTYATAPDVSEIEGWGSSARWRTSPPREPRPSGPAGRSGSTSNADGADPGDAPASPAARLASYRDDGGATRDLVAVKLSDATLVIDRVSDSHDDARLVGRLGDDEPPQNAEILTRLYLADPSRGRCRRLTWEDLQVEHMEPSVAQMPGTPWDAPLVAGIGTILRVQVVTGDATRKEVRWTKAAAREGGRPEPISLRCVVGELQDYQPAVAMTAAAIRAHEQRPGHSTFALRSELRRVIESPIVLNRRLRERVEHGVGELGLTMSEIALRCGRIKRDKRGNESGETSWLARRIGQLPEAGAEHPTPWVHGDVLALIARDGLGVSPYEVEVPWQE
jgi:hypothetical protein